MDEIVKKAMAKWPNVPACSGWLGLDARGQWYMRDAQTQERGPFPQSKGQPLAHAGLAEFIGRNYAADEQGRWYFQNGPQRVFVELEAAPWVLRVACGADGQPQLHTHTGQPVQWGESWQDEHGRVFIATQLGLGLVHSMDMLALSDCIEQRPDWQPQATRFAQLQQRYGFVCSPQQQEAAAQTAQTASGD
ncbi:hypothetical protein CLI92_13380 [Vandammella animalimorsus]|uniref:DUF2946 family protein n=1 Tax=Vandammella animalimorsus TaxID=2029117 RepID=A0A2A2T2G1_9BURK|nr:DUF2946 family protein [Vandammella animalimorsus]PAT30645.1 hypothetical protein CK626_14295 [Vandammella animalimorsus]PAX15655.1 hypothetical protein CLI92_13380 [Vandammella animalimorsus]PAX17652.1 hypothetical protein CLI93_13490 [Vandammella animalimorsus]